MKDDFLNKIESGKDLSSSDWESYLKEAHKKAPGMTPSAFQNIRDKEGFNSYQRLLRSAELKHRNSILDLACGDGHLFSYIEDELGPNFSYVGVDMSESELALARQKLEGRAKCNFLNERAQNLSLESESCDRCLCHMAFMLMSPVDEVISEIKRVLKPGGRFCAVVGSRKVANGLLKEFHKLLSKHLDSNISNLNKVPMGDSRTTTKDGIRELFSENDWNVKDISDFSLDIECSPDEIWNLFKDMYFIDLLDAEQKDRLRKKIVGLASENSSGGLVRTQFPMMLLTLEKRARRNQAGTDQAQV